MVLLISFFSAFQADALTQLAAWFSDGALGRLGFSLGGILAVTASIKLLRHRSSLWVSVRARLSRCTVEVVPAVFLRTRKIIQFSCAYSYEVAGKTYHGANSVVETKELYYDPRRHMRECMSLGEMEVLYHRTHPERSCRFLPPRRKTTLSLAAGLGLMLASAASLVMLQPPHPEAGNRGSLSTAVPQSPAIYAQDLRHHRPARQTTGASGSTF